VSPEFTSSGSVRVGRRTGSARMSHVPSRVAAPWNSCGSCVNTALARFNPVYNLLHIISHFQQRRRRTAPSPGFTHTLCATLPNVQCSNPMATPCPSHTAVVNPIYVVGPFRLHCCYSSHACMLSGLVHPPPFCPPGGDCCAAAADGAAGRLDSSSTAGAEDAAATPAG